jgi:hypothetical protein
MGDIGVKFAATHNATFCSVSCFPIIFHRKASAILHNHVGFARA